jgi:hypothetical protein
MRSNSSTGLWGSGSSTTSSLVEASGNGAVNIDLS